MLFSSLYKEFWDMVFLCNVTWSKKSLKSHIEFFSVQSKGHREFAFVQYKDHRKLPLYSTRTTESLPLYSTRTTGSLPLYSTRTTESLHLYTLQDMGHREFAIELKKTFYLLISNISISISFSTWPDEDDSNNVQLQLLVSWLCRMTGQVIEGAVAAAQTLTLLVKLV